MRKPVLKLGTATPSSQPAEKQIIDANINTHRHYKKVSGKQYNFCPYRCCTCHLVGNSLLQMQFDNQKNILLEDDHVLIFQPFGREIVK